MAENSEVGRSGTRWAAGQDAQGLLLGSLGGLGRQHWLFAELCP